MSEEYKSYQDLESNSLIERVLTKEKSKLMNCSIYSYDGISINIDTNSNTLFQNLANKTNESSDNINESVGSGIVIDINFETKNKSMVEIKDILIQKLWINSENKHELDSDSKNKVYILEEIKDEISSSSNGSEDLVTREKHSKLTANQIKLLSSKILEGKFTVSELSRIYSISRSVLIRLKNKGMKNVEQIPLRKFSKVEIKTRNKLKEMISAFDNTWSYPYWVEDVQKYLYDELKIDYPKKLISDIMKNDVNLSYKRCSSRPSSINIDRINLLRKIFWINFADIIDNNALIANWDEWSITRNTKLNYSWSKSSFNQEFLNKSFAGNKSIIMTIFANGWWFVLISNSNTNAEIFEFYLKKLNCWLVSKDLFGYQKLWLTLDNWSYHKGKKIVKLMRSFNWNTLFLPPYSPSLAPIELAFGYLKKMLAKKWRGDRLNLNTKGANQHILTEMKKLTKPKICSLFRHFYKELRINLSNS